MRYFAIYVYDLTVQHMYLAEGWLGFVFSYLPCFLFVFIHVVSVVDLLSLCKRIFFTHGISIIFFVVYFEAESFAHNNHEL
jgi:hypothetical protein